MNLLVNGKVPLFLPLQASTAPSASAPTPSTNAILPSPFASSAPLGPHQTLLLIADPEAVFGLLYSMMGLWTARAPPDQALRVQTLMSPGLVELITNANPYRTFAEISAVTGQTMSEVGRARKA